MEEQHLSATKTLIMDAAERLYAAHGFEATSVRAITGEAKVNVGAVNYHFTSKDALILAVLKRRMQPINDQRLALLEKFQARAGNLPLPVNQIMEALFRPPLELMTSCRGGDCFVRLIAQVLAGPGDYLVPLIKEEFAEKMRRFHEALHRALPELSDAEIYWKLHFAMGAFVHTAAHSRLLELLSHGKCRTADVELTLAEIIAFCAAGFKARGESPYTAISK